MCGLFGFVLPADMPMSESIVARGRTALATLNHREPDQFGVALVDNLFIGHTRLSVLDLSEDGRQPFQSADGRTYSAVNGEIYNFKDLRGSMGD